MTLAGSVSGHCDQVWLKFVKGWLSYKHEGGCQKKKGKLKARTRQPYGCLAKRGILDASNGFFFMFRVSQGPLLSSLSLIHACL